ncbi:hypothetical protein Tcan_02469 [Toxocara canis]|uniref:AMP-binding domain-containing protein n=1 Tax=Toxocara canis TaxID=6265 RepID=A0A0B2UPF3_TOXCA|nr:hypothetical protein Tcan_02469 [Toxocara canis]
MASITQKPPSILYSAVVQMACARLTQRWLCSRALVRCLSSVQNNLTSRMGLEDNFDGAARSAIIVDERTVLSYRDLAKRVSSFVRLLHSNYSLQVS